jgi:uncharacterized SAM-dependent methyltransferase
MHATPKIHETMRRRRVNAMIADARFLRMQSRCAELWNVIGIERRKAMLVFTLGENTREECDAILDTLNGANAPGDSFCNIDVSSTILARRLTRPCRSFRISLATVDS